MDAYTTKEGLWQPVEEGALAPLSGRYLVRLQEGGGLLGKRQDLPPEAFSLEMEHTTPVALSYRWLSKSHPDPDGFHLAIVCRIVKKFVGWNLGSNGDVGLFWDFGSLYQNPRDPDQDDLFKKGLAASNIWYASTVSLVWLQPHLPLGTMDTYDQSGWCFCEASISSSMKDSGYRLDTGQIEIDDLLTSVSTSGEVRDYDWLRDKCVKNRLPPLSPDKFELKLRQEKKFTNGKEDFDHVVKIYNKYFDVISGSVTQLTFDTVCWSAEHLRDFADALPLFTNLKILSLSHNHLCDDSARAVADVLQANATLTNVNLNNNEIGDCGAVALAGAVQANATLKHVDLRFNKIGDRGAVALAGAVKVNGKIDVSFGNNPGYKAFERKQRQGPIDASSCPSQ